MFITSFLNLKKSFFVIFGGVQSDFCENLTEFYQISLKVLVDLRLNSTVYGMYDGISMKGHSILWKIASRYVELLCIGHTYIYFNINPLYT